MDAESFLTYLLYAQDLKPAQRKRLSSLLKREGVIWHELIPIMLHEGKWMGQKVMLWDASSS